MTDARVSQRALAETTGVSKQSVTNWLGDVHEPGLLQLKKIARALGVSVAYLAGEDQTKRAERSAAGDDLIERFGRLHASAALRPMAAQAPELLDLLSAAERLARQRKHDEGS
jgi:transcriptional regulator with XRE-family HTH domain